VVSPVVRTPTKIFTEINLNTHRQQRLCKAIKRYKWPDRQGFAPNPTGKAYSPQLVGRGTRTPPLSTLRASLFGPSHFRGTQRCCTQIGAYGHVYKLQPVQYIYRRIRKYFFSQRAIGPRNSLPASNENFRSLASYILRES